MQAYFRFIKMITYNSNTYKNRWGELEDFYKLNETKKMQSNLFKLNWKDILNGLIVALYGAILTFLYQVVNGGVFSWNALWVVSSFTAVSYLMKRFTSDSQGTFLGEK